MLPSTRPLSVTSGHPDSCDPGFTDRPARLEKTRRTPVPAFAMPLPRSRGAVAWPIRFVGWRPGHQPPRPPSCARAHVAVAHGAAQGAMPVAVSGWVRTGRRFMTGRVRSSGAEARSSGIGGTGEPAPDRRSIDGRQRRCSMTDLAKASVPLDPPRSGVSACLERSAASRASRVCAAAPDWPM